MWMFTAVIEPLLLYTARFQFHDARDAEHVVRATLLSFTALDVFHMIAILSVTGIAPAIPGTKDAYTDTMLNVYIPPVCMALRSLWLFGVGRESSRRGKTAYESPVGLQFTTPGAAEGGVVSLAYYWLYARFLRHVLVPTP